VNTWTTTRIYQGRQVSPSANRDKRSNLRGFVAGIAMKKMATITVIVPKRRRGMEPKLCQKSKKMIVKMGLQVLNPVKMGLQVLDPAKGCNGQVRPRVVIRGNDNHKCAYSEFFSEETSKECARSMCHTFERTDRQGYPNC
jgi:hypothetical protein